MKQKMKTNRKKNMRVTADIHPMMNMKKNLETNTKLTLTINMNMEMNMKIRTHMEGT
jgi:hypothetical protein